MIVADENIPYVTEAFAGFGFGKVRTMAAKAMTPETVRDARILLVRSVTRVDDALLDGSAVEFVATATIGTDHVDTGALARRGVGFASAPGSNATSVAEWVVAALLAMGERFGIALGGKALGIVGVGNVGGRVAPRARALGMNVLLCDPPRARAGESGFLPLADVLTGSDFVTIHVPLTREGEDKTLDLVDRRFLDVWLGPGGGDRRRKAGALFLNASRGGVVDEPALRAALEDGRLAGAALDVWRGEPDIHPDTLARAAIATPHIAGYSFDGKVAGTRMIYEAACRHFRRAPDWDPTPLLPAPTVPELAAPADALEPALRALVRRVYDIKADDAALRKSLSLPAAERGAWFTKLRKEYPVRREFRFTRVTGADAALARALAGLDFDPT